MKRPLVLCVSLSFILFATIPSFAQDAPASPPPAPAAPPPGDGPPPFLGFPGPGGRGPGGPGFMQQDRKLVKQFDKDGDNRLDAAERSAAREFLGKEAAEGRGPRGPGGPRGPRGPGAANQEPPQPGPKLTPADARSFPQASLYDPFTLRTIFLEFESTDWEKELTAFNNTDVEVPARMTVDGRIYDNVGVHFRGMSSYFMVPEGRKRSLNLSLDYVNKDQRLAGYRTLNLLNSAGDPTFLRAILYSHIAREYLAAPKVNYVRVVINGESWGIYVNQQQFNKDFTGEFLGSGQGERWHVPGSPGGQGSLAYLGDDPAKYKQIYEIKSKDDPESWDALIRLCKVLNETPADQIEKALGPLLDIDGALKFLALENALINTDGYWIRTSDYNLYRGPDGRFRIVPHDMNEGFKSPEGPGFGRRRSPDAGNAAGPEQKPAVPGSTPAGKLDLDPLVAASNPGKPLISKLLANQELRARYLGYVREIAEKWLDWKTLGPLAEKYQAVIADDVRADTRKIYSTQAFSEGLAGQAVAEGPGGDISLKAFADQRRAYLLRATAPAN